MTHALLLALLLSASPALAEHAKVRLDVETPRETTTAFVDQTPPPSGKTPRPVARAKVGEALKIRYMLENVYPHQTLESVVVHFYVARIGQVGQKELPDVDGGDGTALETAFDLDLRPGAQTGGRATLRLDRPGVYLVRVESRNTGSDHEHFAAIDLVIEPE